MVEVGEVREDELIAARRRLVDRLMPVRHGAGVRINATVRTRVPEPLLDTRETAERFAVIVQTSVDFVLACLERGSAPDPLPETIVEQMRRPVGLGVPAPVLGRRYTTALGEFWTWVDDQLDQVRFSEDPLRDSQIRLALGNRLHQLERELACLYQAAIAAVYAEQTRLQAVRAEPLVELTPQQRAVYALMLEGKSDREISETLHISEHTAHNHARDVRKKFGVSHRRQLRFGPPQPPPESPGEGDVTRFPFLRPSRPPRRLPRFDIQPGWGARATASGMAPLGIRRPR
jgi:DNA-binding CsgD family transcriptional regulator